MKRILTIVAAAFVAMTTQAQTRQTICLNDGWKFQLGDVGNAEKADFNDNGWRTLTLPHDFQIEQPWVPPTADERPDNTDVAANIKSRLSSRGFKEMGRGWYRLHFTPADSLKGRRVLIDFAGIMYVGDVYLNGELVGEYLTEELPQVKLVAKMIGKDLEELKSLGEVEEKKSDIKEIFYEAKDLSSSEARPFDFNIHKGEVNGFTGLLGSGRSESVRAVFGADKVTGGTVKVNGKNVRITKPIDAMKNGIGYLAEDRKRDGIIADLSVRENIILAAQVMKGFFRPISRSEAEAFADEYIKVLNIKTASRETPVGSLSGGNQQKVILARWLLTHPNYLILDEPTRGIDVGTKLEIQKLVLKLAEDGVAVTFISSEIEEMLRTCSRLIVMRDRNIVGELTGADLNEAQIMKTIAGGEAANEKEV